MQTQTLPIQVSGASASPAPQRSTGVANADNAQFSQALSREMEQRQSSPAPAAARQPAPAARQQAAAAPKNAPAPAQAQAAPAEGKPAKPSADAGADESSEADAVAADAAAATPVADMLALVASFNQPVAVTVAPAANPLAAAATEGADLEGYAAMLGKAASGPAALASTGQALVPASEADDTVPAFKDVAKAIEGADRFSMKAPAGGAEPKAAASAPFAPFAPSAPSAPLAETAIDTPTARAGAAQQPDLAAAAKAGARSEATDAAQLAPLRTREAAVDVTVLKDVAAAAPASVPLQQASLALAHAVSGVATDKIAARVGTPGWDNQVGQKIIWMVAGKEQSASLTLNPPDMGPMQVVLSVTNDQATVTFSAAQPEVRQALENAMPKLREMMGESGIALGNATVNDGAQEQRQAQQGEQRRGQAGGRFGGAGAEGAIETSPRQARTGGGAGLVDTFA